METTKPRMKSKDIIKVNGEIGFAIEKGRTGEFLFWSRKERHYSEEALPKAEHIEEATNEERIAFLIKLFPWGEVKATHQIGEYLIFEYKNKEGETRFTPHIDYREAGFTYETRDKALVGAIAYKNEGPNGRAAEYFWRMLGN